MSWSRISWSNSFFSFRPPLTALNRRVWCMKVQRHYLKHGPTGLKLGKSSLPKGPLSAKKKNIRRISKLDGRFNKMKKKFAPKNVGKYFLNSRHFLIGVRIFDKRWFLASKPSRNFFCFWGRKVQITSF